MLKLEQELAAARALIDSLEKKLSELTKFPGPPDYNSDFLAVWNKSVDHFMDDQKFLAAYRTGMDSGHSIGRDRGSREDIHIEWRIHTVCWAAKHASLLDGDFVECGVNTGIMSLAACEYLDFDKLGKTFWLFDTFEGPPLEQMTSNEVEAGREVEAELYFDCFEIAKRNFSRWTNTKLVKGRIPDSLQQVKIEKIAYLCVDMNYVEPERAALQYFWPKLVRGGVVVLDDYGWKQCRLQKDAHDAWAREVGVEILLLPTGQGLILKP